MQSQKIHNEKLNSGISSVAGSPRGAIKNLILKNEGSYKRQGHKANGTFGVGGVNQHKIMLIQ